MTNTSYALLSLPEFAEPPSSPQTADIHIRCTYQVCIVVIINIIVIITSEVLPVGT